MGADVYHYIVFAFWSNPGNVTFLIRETTSARNISDLATPTDTKLLAWYMRFEPLDPSLLNTKIEQGHSIHPEIDQWFLREAVVFSPEGRRHFRTRKGLVVIQ